MENPYPGKSTSLISSLTLKKLTSVVLPGVLLVLANFLFFAKQLRALDFPAFDLPAKTNSKPSSGGAFLYLIHLA